MSTDPTQAPAPEAATGGAADLLNENPGWCEIEPGHWVFADSDKGRAYIAAGGSVVSGDAITAAEIKREQDAYRKGYAAAKALFPAPSAAAGAGATVGFTEDPCPFADERDSIDWTPDEARRWNAECNRIWDARRLARLAEPRPGGAADLPPLSDAAATLLDHLVARANAIVDAAMLQAGEGDRAVMLGAVVQGMAAARSDVSGAGRALREAAESYDVSASPELKRVYAAFKANERRREAALARAGQDGEGWKACGVCFTPDACREWKTCGAVIAAQPSGERS